MSDQFIPSIEKRIATWTELQKKRKAQDEKDVAPQTAITISREFGCEAYPLAEQLKAKLDTQTDQTWTIFDDALIDSIVADHELSRHLLKNYGERAKYLDFILSSLLPAWKSEAEAFKPMLETVFSIAQQGNAIIVGRGAFTIAANLSNCYHVRLIAPIEFRALKYANNANMSLDDSISFVREKEELRTRFLKHFANCQFKPADFHLVINNATAPIEVIADTVLYFVLNSR